MVVFEKTLVELDKLVFAFYEMRQYAGGVKFFSIFDISKIEKLQNKEPQKAKNISDSILSNNNFSDVEQILKKYKINEAYIPKTIWSYFIAYYSVISFVFGILHILSSNAKIPLKNLNFDRVYDIVEKIIPGFSDETSKENVLILFSDFLNKIDELLIDEITKFIDLGKIDTKSIESANKIIQLSKKLQQENSSIAHSKISDEFISESASIRSGQSDSSIS